MKLTLTPLMCTVSDVTGEAECRRVAAWQWQADGPDTHPVFLCNFHAEPFADQIMLTKERTT